MGKVWDGLYYLELFKRKGMAMLVSMDSIVSYRIFRYDSIWVLKRIQKYKNFSVHDLFCDSCMCMKLWHPYSWYVILFGFDLNISLKSKICI